MNPQCLVALMVGSVGIGVVSTFFTNPKHIRKVFRIGFLGLLIIYFTFLQHLIN